MKTQIKIVGWPAGTGLENHDIWLTVDAEIIETPHAPYTFAVHRSWNFNLHPPRESRLWTVSNIESGFTVLENPLPTRKQAIAMALARLATRSPEMLAACVRSANHYHPMPVEEA